ncbi:hypothetical protein [Streptomyces mangrovisoli]|uniref:DUF305 domain-containing protein n=1 Tax=Streptomyces mangrovisoli TaxID=1428628 RepID=A0A1J4P2R1_9ACTN|nr:hypothetical protein [Streptomyces mangrovisoli]OIJ67726.1 hypothetical protein WN71_011690 [Streptomyces mangrovisoli]
MTRATARRAAAAALLAAALLTTGCARHGGDTGSAEPGPHAATPSGYPQMEQKVNAAESAAAAADKDTAQDH